jgi:hypothetical protein
MRSQLDPLYAIFEKHLLNALVEDEATEEFLARVVADYLAALAKTCVIPMQVRPMIEEDLREEVLEMLRKKTYGHYSLRDFRKASATDRRGRKAPAPAVAKSAPAAEPDPAEAAAVPRPAPPAPRGRRRRSN